MESLLPLPDTQVDPDECRPAPFSQAQRLRWIDSMELLHQLLIINIEPSLKHVIDFTQCHLSEIEEFFF